MLKRTPIIPIKGTLLFALSFTDPKSGPRKYSIVYNENLDKEKDGTSQLVGAMYKMMSDYPELVEQMAHAVTLALSEMSEPFNEILKQK